MVNARQLASLVRHCGGACSEDDVKRAMAEIRTGEPLDNVQSFEEFCKVLERWPGTNYNSAACPSPTDHSHLLICCHTHTQGLSFRIWIRTPCTLSIQSTWRRL